MVLHMKTTLNIDNSVMRRLREEAARRGVTMSVLVEAGLRRILDGSRKAGGASGRLSALPSWSGGEPRVDVANRNELYAVMEDR